MLCKKRKQRTCYARPCLGRSHLPFLLLLTTCPSLDPMHRKAQDREQDARTKEKTLLRENQERLKLELQSQQAYSAQELKALLPNMLHAVNKNIGSEEFHWGRNVIAHIVKIPSMQRTIGYKLDGHRYHWREWLEINCLLNCYTEQVSL